jgi:hypothetical protein
VRPNIGRRPDGRREARQNGKAQATEEKIRDENLRRPRCGPQDADADYIMRIATVSDTRIVLEV